MNAEHPRPSPALRAVAYLNIAGGLAACLHMVMARLAGRPLVNVCAVFLLIGWGLLRVRPGWRKIAIVTTVAVPLSGAVVAATELLARGTTQVRFIGFGSGLPVGIAVTALLVALVIWELRVLTSARTKALFAAATSLGPSAGPGPAAAPPGSGPGAG